MRIGLLGSTGQVGWELARALAPLGELAAPARNEVDLTDPGRIEAFLAAAKPDVLVNAAAYTDVDQAESEPDLVAAINCEAVAVMAKAMAGRGMLVHYSTDYVFDGQKEEPYLETDATRPLGVYGRSKRDGEDAVRAAGVPHFILRTSWVHAARGRNFVRTMLRLARENSEIKVVSDQIGAPTGAELIADVTAHLLTRPARGAPNPGTYHLAAAGRTSWNGFARFVLAEALAAGAELTCCPDRVHQISTKDYPTAAARQAHSLLDTTRIRREYNVTLPDWRFHARRTVRELVCGGTV